MDPSICLNMLKSFVTKWEQEPDWVPMNEELGMGEHGGTGPATSNDLATDWGGLGLNDEGVKEYAARMERAGIPEETRERVLMTFSTYCAINTAEKKEKKEKK